MDIRLLLEASLNKLIRSNKKITNERAKDPDLKVKLKAYNKGTKKARFFMKGKTDDYDMYIEFEKPQAFINLAKQEVKLSCSCPDFKFRCNHTLEEKHGAAERRYDNGKPPVITNPTGEQVICKHLVKLKKELRNYRFTENMNIQKV